MSHPLESSVANSFQQRTNVVGTHLEPGSSPHLLLVGRVEHKLETDGAATREAEGQDRLGEARGIQRGRLTTAEHIGETGDELFLELRPHLDMGTITKFNFYWHTYIVYSCHLI